MKILVAANLALGSNSTPALFATHLADFAVARQVRHVVLLNLFSHVPNYWQMMAGSKDYRESIGEHGPLWRTVAMAGLHLVLGPHDLWLDHQPFRAVRDEYEGRGAVIHRAVADDVAGLLVSSGCTGTAFAAPPEPRHWLSDRLGLTRPPLGQTARVGVRREGLAEFSDWSAHHGHPALAHGLPGLPTWGRAGEAWLGGPGDPPNVLLVDTLHWQGSQIVKV